MIDVVGKINPLKPIYLILAQQPCQAIVGLLDMISILSGRSHAHEDKLAILLCTRLRGFKIGSLSLTCYPCLNPT